MGSSTENLVPAVFVDRDGVIVKDLGYATKPDDLSFIENSGKAIRLLKNAGYLVVLITNQSAIGRGILTIDGLEEIHERLFELLAADGGKLDAVYFCPHHPDDGCSCRKPYPGMITQAAAEHRIDLEDSYMIGDKITDIEAGMAAGCKPILVRPDDPVRSASDISPVTDTLYSAVQMIIRGT